MRHPPRRVGPLFVGLVALMVLSACGQSSGSAPAVDFPHTSSSAAAEPDPTPVRRASNVPIRPLAPGEKPPQFVLFSFDGVGVSKNWDLFLEAAERSDARFSALMTGLYFLTDKAKKRYRGPGYRPGESALAFGGTKAEVIEQIEYLNRTWYGGHELGTHYVGHFCAGTRNPGKNWSTREWNHELDQFFSLMANWRSNDGITTGPDLAFGPQEVKGGRTQCLEGTPAKLFPALRAHDMTWDSSMPAAQPGVYWPSKISGIWEFQIPYAWSPPLRKRQTVLDYNFWYTVNGAQDRPKDKARIRRVVLDTYRYMFKRAYEGNRAPLVIANHMNDWNGNAFNPATAQFMTETCGRPEVICATHADVVAWLEVQDPKVLQEWTSRPPVAVSANQ
ncbi:polysaccharide deacetylase [Gordonia sp. NB41Y]|uniref:polysaccharide deacetylase n=1 Tax=Gordonia sp. NB41Y TaxID=875808 RepID=UPI0006B15A40|nr:polysaccharide deacetylase [Gordonia sp. NB41Y]EMP11024.2 polysaccharide deacetylase [Gordonia sp. NB41Y]WLP89138.1 polysaccharide deacetylase [Gordonia sp. NB41Y]